MAGVGRARRVAGRAGAPSLWQTNVREVTDTKRCLSLTVGPAPGPTEDCQSTGSDAVLLAASCATRRLSVGIAVRAGTRVVADTGGTTRRAVRLRRGKAVLTLPGARPLRSLTFIRRGRKRRVEIGAPPAARQCGWHFSPDVEELQCPTVAGASRLHPRRHAPGPPSNGRGGLSLREM